MGVWVFFRLFFLFLYAFVYFVYYCGGSRWRCDEERHSPWQWRGAIYIAILSDPGIKERKITIYWQQGNILGECFFFSHKIEICGLHWHDMSAPFKRFKWACLYRSQKMLWSSIRGCSSRALKTFELVQKLAKSAGDHSSTQTVGLWGGHNRL